MSFQTVKCPKCGNSSMEYMNPDEVVKCEACTHKFKPFEHLKQLISKPPVPKSEPAKHQSHADEIFASVKSISKLLADCLKEEWLSAGEEQILTQIKSELKQLFNIICQTMDSPQGLKPALATVFTFPDLSSRLQTLELILTYFYGGMFQLQDKSVRMLFEDYGHQMIANELVEKNKAKVAQLIG